MSEKKKHTNVSEKELDNLLNQAFLDLDFTNPKNQELMETISQEVMQPKPVSYIDLINKSLFTKILGTVLLTLIIITIYLAFFKTSTNNLNHKQLARTEIHTTPNLKPEEQKQTENPVIISKEENNKKKDTTIVTEEKQEIQNTISYTESSNNKKPLNDFIEEKPTKIEDTGFVFPKLTEKEIEENNRQKLNMSVWLVKPNMFSYPLIGLKPHQQIFVNATDTSSVFYMKRDEVSNLEYRTFLLDLIIHDRKEDFMKAKPHQELWLTAPGDAMKNKMKDNYFSDEKYNYYPVVNITPEGAELYCQWMSTLYKAEDSELYARLPYENEWIKAARSEKKVGAFPGGLDFVQNKSGCHLANYCIKKLSDQLNTHPYCTPKNPNAYTSAEFMKGDSMMTAKVFSYNPNDNGMYCIMGNVAEMVYKNKTKTVVTKGGSWNSDFEHCKINSEEELAGPVKANPMTGFRPVVRLVLKNNFGCHERENPKTGLTTLKPGEIKNYEEEKEKMIETLIKFDKANYSLVPMGTCVYKNEAVSVQGFYMQTTEVTNLQYRTFLADLLIQKREADYLIAKPNQEMWTIKFPWSYNEPMKAHYFWHPAYDKYPVVNISRKAAEMYCTWLTTETNKVLKEKNKPLINDIRIPMDIEWAHAASNKKNKIRYANGLESIKDNKGRYTANYSCYYLNECRYDSTMKLYLPQEAKKPNDKESYERTYKSDGAFHTVTSKFYAPNSYGLYHMAGNVAEMVYIYNTQTKQANGNGTKGGSWFSADEFLQIDANEEYSNETGASPLIGFRPVFTSTGKQ